MSCPWAIGVRSTSIGAPAASVEASGFIWEMKGQSVAAPPTAAAAPVATKRKSRRVGWSAEDAVVTIPNPFLAAAGGTAQETPKADAQERDQVWLPAPATPRGGRDRLFRPQRPTKQSRIVLLAPLQKERKPTIRPQACNALNPCRPLFYSRIQSISPDATRAFSARHPPKHRDDSQAVRLLGCGSPYHRTRGLSGVRPGLPPGRDGLSRSGAADPPRLVDEIRGMAPRKRLPAGAFHHQRRHFLS